MVREGSTGSFFLLLTRLRPYVAAPLSGDGSGPARPPVRVQSLLWLCRDLLAILGVVVFVFQATRALKTTPQILSCSVEIVLTVEVVVSMEINYSVSFSKARSMQTFLGLRTET